MISINDDTFEHNMHNGVKTNGLIMVRSERKINWCEHGDVIR